MPEPAEASSPPLAVFFAPMDAAALAYALPLAHKLRTGGLRVEIEHRGGKVSSAARARRQAAGAPGRHHRQQRVASGQLTVKDLANGTQSTVAAADLLKIRQLLD